MGSRRGLRRRVVTGGRFKGRPVIPWPRGRAAVAAGGPAPSVAPRDRDGGRLVPWPRRPVGLAVAWYAPWRRPTSGSSIHAVRPPTRISPSMIVRIEYALPTARTTTFRFVAISGDCITPDALARDLTDRRDV